MNTQETAPDIRKRRNRNHLLFESAVRAGNPRFDPELALLHYDHPAGAGGHVAQESLEYAIALAECGEEPERVRRIVRSTLRCQDRRRHSYSYGNWFWMHNMDQVLDANAVSFLVPNYHYLVTHHSTLLGEDLSGEIVEAASLAGEALLAHRCQWPYGNIYLLNILAKLQVADLTNDERIRNLAMFDWQEWLSYTDHFGITEFNSTTYTAVQISALESMSEVPADEIFHRQVHKMMRLYYTEICLHYHPGSGLFAGAKSRLNISPMSTSMMHTVLFCQTGFHQPEDSPYNANFALTDYVAPPDVLNLATDKTLPLDLQIASPHAGLNRRAWITRPYAVSTASGGQYGATDVLLETVFGREGKRGVIFTQGEPNQYDFFCKQRENLVVGGFRWRFHSLEERDAIASQTPLSRMKFGYGPVHLDPGTTTAEVTITLAFSPGCHEIWLNADKWDESPTTVSGDAFLSVESHDVFTGVRVGTGEDISIAWEDDVARARIRVQQPDKTPWTVTQPVLWITESREEAGSREAFNQALQQSKLTRQAQRDYTKLVGTWRGRELQTEVPIKPDFLMQWGTNHLPVSRLANVIQSDHDLSLWSEY